MTGQDPEIAIHARRLRDREIVKLFVVGHTLREIAAGYGISKMRVCQVIHRAGLSRFDGGSSWRARQRDFQGDVKSKASLANNS